MLQNRRRLLILSLLISIVIITLLYIFQYKQIDYHWAATGEWVAFSCSPVGEIDKSSLYITRPDGTNVQRLTQDGLIASMPSWSPDGESLAFVNNKSIFSMNLSNLETKRILDNENLYWDRSPVWSPDGNWIAFISNRAGNGEWDIYKVKEDGSSLQRLTSGLNTQSTLMWSPDGESIVFASTTQSSSKSKIYVMDNDGNNLRRITSSEESASDPAWSPDGEWIIFSMEDRRGVNLYRSEIDGSNLQSLTASYGANTYPEWSSTMRWIVFSSKDRGLSQISKLDVENDTLQQITNLDCNAIAPTWLTFLPASP